MKQFTSGSILLTISVGILFGYNVNIVSGIFSATAVWGIIVAISGYTNDVLISCAKIAKRV